MGEGAGFIAASRGSVRAGKLRVAVAAAACCLAASRSTVVLLTVNSASGNATRTTSKL